MQDLPFREGTRIYEIFQILSDEQWHCGKHELPGTQPAKAIQIIRQNGYEIENQTVFCSVCGYRTVHRRLVSIQPTQAAFVRSQFPERLRRRIKRVYGNVEAVTQRTYQPAQLEVDHRFPQVRWSSSEGTNDPDMPEPDIRRKFQLLTRQHNLWKSRYCENCVETGVRGTFIGIIFYYQGGPEWPEDVPPGDERGCFGCFWYNPQQWREELNKLIAQMKEDEQSGE